MVKISICYYVNSRRHVDSENIRAPDASGLKLERLPTEFENRGFRSRRSLTYVKSEDLDAFFPSPDKLLLAERRALEAELENIRSAKAPRSTVLEPKRLKMTQNLESNAYAVNCSAQKPDSSVYGGFSSRSESAQVKTHSSLDRRALDLTENLQILLVQIESAKQQLEKKRKEIKWKNCPMLTIDAGRCVPHATNQVITKQGAQTIHVPM